MNEDGVVGAGTREADDSEANREVELLVMLAPSEASHEQTALAEDCT